MMFEKKPAQPQQKMMQVNVLDVEGKLNINIKKKGFTPTEAIGILELAKCQIRNSMKMEKNFDFRKKK